MKRNGFTLIELLVVVLIIGILAAVALPQYERAVLKARYSELQTVIAAYKTAAEVYYLANGEYPSYWNDMDFTPPAGWVTSDSAPGGPLSSGKKNLSIDLYDDSNKSFAGLYSPNGSVKLAYIQWLDASQYPGRRECWAKDGDADAQNFCRALGGTERGKSTNWYCTSSGGCTAYILP